MSKPASRVIINADDFGLSASVNQSIALAFDAGSITSTTILLDRPGTRDALTIAKERPGLAIGLHLDLDRFFGFEVSGHYGVTMADIDMLRYRRCLEEESVAIAKEIEAQIDAAESLGLQITHLDGHHHIHLFPGVLPLVVRAMSRFGLRRTRLLQSFFGANSEVFELSRRLLDSQGITYPDWFVAFDSEESLSDIIDHLRTGVTEIMVHTDLPGCEATDWRACQFELLLDANNPFRTEDGRVRLISYAGLR